jgi:hypothetical protein
VKATGFNAQWLVPEGSPPGQDEWVRMLPAGVLWDAVRTPQELALRQFPLLLRDDEVRLRLGPVLHDSWSRHVYWLVTPGHSASYPRPCRLIGAGGWLAVPGAANIPDRLAWLHLPQPGILSSPAWLATALHGDAL